MTEVTMNVSLLRSGAMHCRSYSFWTDMLHPYYFYGPGSTVGIATGYGLDGLAIYSRWGTRFSAPVQNGPGAHPASCTMGTGSFPGIKSGWGVRLTPHPLLVPHIGCAACTRLTFTFFFMRLRRRFSEQQSLFVYAYTAVVLCLADDSNTPHWP